MVQRIHADDRDSATRTKFYVPAGVTPPFDASPFERLWGTLFAHQVDPPE